jgi:hypothetical protein
MNRRISPRLIARTLLVSLVVLLAGSAYPAHAQVELLDLSNGFDPYTPIFTKANVKIAQTASWSFTSQLVFDAVNYEPNLIKPGTQVHMGFWSGDDNHGNLVRVLDAINFAGITSCVSGSMLPNCAVWDEGATSSEQYPAYVQMLVEHWYDRGNAGTSSPTVTIYGKTYKNRNPLTFTMADQVWGQYSQRYADMARVFARKTGMSVMAWCFVQGASPKRIFYAYEYPELQELESEGVVEVFCAKSADAIWTNPNDWTQGIGSAACPPPSSLGVVPEEQPINVYNR